MNFSNKSCQNLTVLGAGLLFSLFLALPPKVHAQWGSCPPDWAYSNYDWQAKKLIMYYGAPGVPVDVSNPYNSFGVWMNDNVSELSFPDIKDKDYDGWVHLAHDFGTPTSPSSNPYMFLYNWKSGVLRAFFLITDRKDDYNTASVQISFANIRGNKKSALLSSLQGTVAINAVERFNQGQGIGINKWVNKDAYWLRSDFPMMYDPCTCLMNGQDSKITIEAKLSKNVAIQATVNGQVLEKFQELTGQNETTIGGSLKKASEGFGKVAEIQKANKEYVKDYQKDNNGVDKKPSWVNEFVGLLGPIGKYLGFADFLVGLLDPPSTLTPKPLEFDVKLDLTGSFVWEGGFQDVLLQTPGTNESTSDPDAIGKNIADFNNVLGTFNLLKMPKITMRQSAVQDWLNEDANCTSYGYTTQFECTEPLKYVFNPFFMFLGTPNVQANYIIEYNTGEKIITPSFPIGCFTQYKPVFSGVTSSTSPCSGFYHTNPVGCKLQIYADLPTGNGTKLVFLRSYNVELTTAYVSESLAEILPNAGCSDMSPASLGEISSVCNSDEYINRRDFNALNASTEAEYIANFEKEKAKRLAVKYLKNEIENTLDVFPNPTTSVATISFNIQNQESKVNLYLTDISGKVISTWLQDDLRNKGKHNINFERKDLAAGLYFIVLETDQNKAVKKLFLE